MGRFPGGYIYAENSASVKEVEFQLEHDDDNPFKPVRGHMRAIAEDGSELAGQIESITGTEVDITHCLVPPARPIYRRALIRFTPDDGSPPVIGWLECNRLPKD